jgi:arylsulfatase
MQRAPDVALLLAWALVLPVELWFGASGFASFEPLRVAGEAAGLAILAANHARFAPEGWLRSPLIPGLLLAGMMATVTVDTDPVRRLLLGAAIGGACALAVRGLHRVTRRAPLAVALVATLAGGTAARAILLTASLGGREAVPHPWGELASELRPLRPSGAGASGPRIAVLTIDTLRADRMVQMQSWKRLAAKGRSWERAMSASSWTLPSMASLATGLPVGEHGATVQPNGHYQGIAPDVGTLAGDLAKQGYTTAAVFTNSWMSAELGFGRGFHRFVHLNGNRTHRLALAGVPAALPSSAATVVDRAIREADALPDRGAFLWVHFVDTHQPYAHAAPGRVQGLGDGSLRAGLILDAAGKAEVIAAYDHEVAVMDVEVLRLLDHLEQTGWPVVALTADHGEEFWDHGGVEHGHSHHGEVVDVGLVLVAPGVPAGPGAGLASLVDLTSTVRAVAGLDPRGQDLRQPIAPDRVATAWGNAFHQHDASARSGSERVIRHADGRIEAYDLASDPAELRPFPPPEGDPLGQVVRGLVPPELREEADINRAALEALGYLAQ